MLVFNAKSVFLSVTIQQDLRFSYFLKEASLPEYLLSLLQFLTALQWSHTTTTILDDIPEFE